MARWKLTDKQWDALDELRFSTTEVAVFRNATVILMSGVGRSVQSIAKELGCSPATVDNVRRRYRQLLEEGGPFPDLIVIDGGKGQLTAAYEALESLGLANLVAVGLAKREELIFTRESGSPIALRSADPALLLLQQIRDEAHRFAVTFHRKARTRRDLQSALDTVPGIGPRRRRLLLTRFGSLAGVRRATREELVAAVGPRVADAVLAYFSRTG